MFRYFIPASLLIMVAVMVGGFCYFAGLKPVKETRAQQLRKQLTETLVDLPKGIDPNTPLKDALEFLSERSGLLIMIDAKAFEAIGVQRPEESAVCLPRMMNVSMKTVLGLLCQADDSTFMVQGDLVVYTTTRHANPAAWAKTRTLAPLIDREFDRLPLDEALQELFDETGISIVVDVRVSEKARKAVTAKLENVPLDTVVRVLADMADLHAVSLENLLYVTSKENAKAMQAELEMQEQANAKAMRAELEMQELVNPFIKRKEIKEKE